MYASRNRDAISVVGIYQTKVNLGRDAGVGIACMERLIVKKVVVNGGAVYPGAGICEIFPRLVVKKYNVDVFVGGVDGVNGDLYLACATLDLVWDYIISVSGQLGECRAYSRYG